MLALLDSVRLLVLRCEFRRLMIVCMNLLVLAYHLLWMLWHKHKGMETLGPIVLAMLTGMLGLWLLLPKIPKHQHEAWIAVLLRLEV